MTSNEKKRNQEQDKARGNTTEQPHRDAELTDDALEQVSGGAVRHTGDEDLEDLEVQR